MFLGLGQADMLRKKDAESLWSTEDEIQLFNLICDYKPAGRNREKNIEIITKNINEGTGGVKSYKVADIVSKLASLYNLEKANVKEEEDSYELEEGDEDVNQEEEMNEKEEVKIGDDKSNSKEDEKGAVEAYERGYEKRLRNGKTEAVLNETDSGTKIDISRKREPEKDAVSNEDKESFIKENSAQESKIASQSWLQDKEKTKIKKEATHRESSKEGNEEEENNANKETPSYIKHVNEETREEHDGIPRRLTRGLTRQRAEQVQTSSKRATSSSKSGRETSPSKKKRLRNPTSTPKPSSVDANAMKRKKKPDIADPEQDDEKFSAGRSTRATTSQNTSATPKPQPTSVRRSSRKKSIQ